MALLHEEDRKVLKELFGENLKDDVEILVFLDYEKNKDYSEIAKEIINELSSIDNRIKGEFIDARTEEGYKKLKDLNLDLDKYGDRRGPIFVFKKKPNIIYFGLPAEQEFTPFIEDIIAVSQNEIDVSMKAAKIIEKIDIPLDIYIFVTPRCPYCPYMTKGAHKFAFLNDRIRGIMIEALEFPEFADNFHVQAVPRNVILHNGEIVLDWEGMIPEAMFAEYVEHAVKHAKGEPHEHK